MKVLFVTTSLPFPPRQGIELPNAHIAKALSEAHTLDLAVVTRNKADAAAFAERKRYVPESINRVLDIRCEDSRSTLNKLLGELFFQQPAFFIKGYDSLDLNLLFRDCDYDAVWFSPVGTLSLIRACKDAGLDIPPLVALGCNDVITTTYLDSLKEWLSGRMGFSTQRLVQGMRTAWIAWHEKKYLKSVDLLHVQTSLEARRARRLLGHQRSQPTVIAAQNGRKALLSMVSYESGRERSSESLKVLYMTHLQGGRAQESSWFLQRVWPQIVAQYPTAELLLAGTPPAEGSAIARQLLDQNVKVLGYVDDLAALYSKVSVSVVPIVHSTGLINRALDALMAGVPLVSTAAVLSTVAGCVPGRDAIAAESTTEFAAAVCALLGDRQKRLQLSASSRALALSQPTWSESTQKILSALEQLVSEYSVSAQISSQNLTTSPV